MKYEIPMAVLRLSGDEHVDHASYRNDSNYE